MNTPVLEVTNLSKNFGGLRALNEVDLTINRQEIVALIGPNGAGKTTFFNCITGIYLPTEGTVQLHLPERNGKPASSTPLNGMKPNEITSLGMARTFQHIRLFLAIHNRTYFHDCFYFKDPQFSILIQFHIHHRIHDFWLCLIIHCLIHTITVDFSFIRHRLFCPAKLSLRRFIQYKD